jgi:glyoxylase-like metal-dependent hydrolase (beta-lactamase superfamily II)
MLKDEDTLELAGFEIQVLHTPGHTPGGVCYYFPQEGVVFSGDTLFCGSVGRTDLPGGSMSALVRSVREKVFSLPDLTLVYPGHGEPTKISSEKQNNPFL